MMVVVVANLSVKRITVRCCVICSPGGNEGKRQEHCLMFGTHY